ncbi:MAG TPA: hypothetical protein VFT64_09045 [Rickettsiales bacterium]|nr:hypothetical protein [Rickettsiales bacterium]
MPASVSLSANAQFGENIKNSSWISKDAVMFEAFKPNGTMDYQRISSSLKDSKGDVLIDKDYINFGNFNYGVVAAAAGYPLDDALSYAAKLNRYHALTNRNINTSGKYGGNVRNEYYIRMGYLAYTSDKIKGAQ